MRSTSLSKSHQQPPQSINNGEARVFGAYDSEATVSQWEWLRSRINTSSHGSDAAQNAYGAFEVGLGEEEAAAIAVEEAERGGEKYNVSPDPRNRLVGLLDVRLALKIFVLALFMLQEGDR